MKGRDAFFRELFGREPTAEEIQRFDRIGSLMNASPDDTMWYVILVNEFYEDRLNTRLSEIDKIADSASERALEKISEAVYKKSEEVAAKKNNGYLLRSWGFAQSMTLLLCVTALNAGYIMGSGKDPFWLRPGNSLERVMSWFFNAPSGWIVLLGSGPFLAEVLWESIEKLRLGIEKDALLLILKSAGAAVALILLIFVVFGF